MLSLATPKGFEGGQVSRCKHRRQNVDPRLKRWGIAVVPT